MRAVNVPNGLTVLRILLIPVLVLALLEDGLSTWLAAAVFAFASMTDAVDGYLARSRAEVTTFGKLMDPIADKLLIVAALVVLVSEDRIPLWIAAVIVARELAVTVSRMIVTAEGVVISANRWGKIKTAVQVAAVFFAIALNPTPVVVDLLLYAAVVATVVSGIEYFVGLSRMRREAAV